MNWVHAEQTGLGKAAGQQLCRYVSCSQLQQHLHAVYQNSNHQQHFFHTLVSFIYTPVGENKISMIIPLLKAPNYFM